MRTVEHEVERHGHDLRHDVGTQWKKKCLGGTIAFCFMTGLTPTNCGGEDMAPGGLALTMSTYGKRYRKG